ncbi:MAG: hypothetical protein KBA31_19580 [Alphaproteobacteria bacterium]|nr:hypothetical protein [Alphaproteobacteria bacterium]
MSAQIAGWLDQVLWMIKDGGFHPLLIAICFGVWGLASRSGGDRVAAGAFGFSAVFAVLWMLWAVQVLLSAVFDTVNWAKSAALFAKMSVALVLFVGCAFLALRSLRRREPLAQPVAVVVALTIAHAFHVSVIATLTQRWLDV